MGHSHEGETRPSVLTRSHRMQIGQQGGHICREWRGKIEPLLAVWVLEAYVLGMQGLAGEGVDSLLQGSVAWEPEQSRTIHRIAKHGMPDMCQVHADLVRTAGFQRETHETYSPPGFYHLVVSAGSTTVALDDGHLLPMLGMASNRCLDNALQG